MSIQFKQGDLYAQTEPNCLIDRKTRPAHGRAAAPVTPPRTARVYHSDSGPAGLDAIIRPLSTGGTRVNDRLKLLLEAVAGGSISIAAALEELRHLPYEDLGFAKIDHHRGLRDALPEVILAEGKTPDQIAAIGERVAAKSGRLLVTRLDRNGFRALQRVVPEAEYDELARVAFVEGEPRTLLPGVMVLCAGTSDLPVAREAVLTARMVGSEAALASDVGVAGIHRLFDRLSDMLAANVLVVVAGMEGALPSVVAGLVSAPVIAVPTSIGYGASFNGLAPLLAMLNSCAAGVSVVNIDNGFGAGYLAAQINALAHRSRAD